jgi:hypothetical protein
MPKHDSVPARDAEIVARTRKVIYESMQLLRRAAADTFLGRKRIKSSSEAEISNLVDSGPLTSPRFLADGD